MQQVLFRKIVQTKWVRHREICSGSRTTALPCLSRLLSSVPVFSSRHWIHLRLLFQAYNIHVNGVLHCRVRYSQLLSLHEQVRLQTLSGALGAEMHVRGAQKLAQMPGHPSSVTFLSSPQRRRRRASLHDTQSQQIQAFRAFFSSNSSRICM